VQGTIVLCVLGWTVVRTTRSEKSEKKGGSEIQYCNRMGEMVVGTECELLMISSDYPPPGWFRLSNNCFRYGSFAQEKPWLASRDIETTDSWQGHRGWVEVLKLEDRYE